MSERRDANKSRADCKLSIGALSNLTLLALVLGLGCKQGVPVLQSRGLPAKIGTCLETPSANPGLEVLLPTDVATRGSRFWILFATDQNLECAIDADASGLDLLSSSEAVRQVYLTWTDDHGGSFSAPQRLYSEARVQGASPAFMNLGILAESDMLSVLVAPTASRTPADPRLEWTILESPDGGETWGDAVFVLEPEFDGPPDFVVNSARVELVQGPDGPTVIALAPASPTSLLRLAPRASEWIFGPVTAALLADEGTGCCPSEYDAPSGGMGGQYQAVSDSLGRIGASESEVVFRAIEDPTNPQVWSFPEPFSAAPPGRAIAGRQGRTVSYWSSRAPGGPDWFVRLPGGEQAELRIDPLVPREPSWEQVTVGISGEGLAWATYPGSTVVDVWVGQPNADLEHRSWAMTTPKNANETEIRHFATLDDDGWVNYVDRDLGLYDAGLAVPD